MDKISRLNTNTSVVAVFLLVITVFGPSALYGDDYGLKWNVIGGGGVIESTGGNISLSGTIAQSDASSALNGNSYSLLGGFWLGVPPSHPTSWDTDSDLKGDIAVWRPNSGFWYTLLSSSNGNFTGTGWGAAIDRPAPGDYDGDFPVLTVLLHGAFPQIFLRPATMMEMGLWT
jgi:hypothetical protein